ncbi:MAG: metallophosphoesterase [Syntrophales bacterium]|nr:metallophosphoesterase [Syntrophales bacterium]MDD5642203.1 metallophosphoesterase [Syntrophales bacterium]
MERREFLRRLGWGLAGGWAASRGVWPEVAAAASAPTRLALLGDAHLRDGQASRAEARALARAVAEIRALKPAPELVLFAGDLAHDGNPRALALGREILAGLPGPLAAVPGEGDGRGQADAAWRRLFGEPRFSKAYDGFHLLGVHTSLIPAPQGQVFALGREQRRQLAREVARLDPDKPLIVLSHAPLGEIFRPWQQWTQDGPEVLRLLSPFSQVYYFHGHVHGAADNFQLSAFSYDLRQPDNSLPTGNRKPKTENFPLPATAWPLPSPLQGTPAAPRPGLGPQGCGWGLVTLGGKSFSYQPQVWTA